MEAAGRYNLAWTDFDQYTTTAFKDLGARREFVDVTLACEGDVQVQAHKVILAACSSWFRSVLLRNSHPHPLIYLDSIGPEQVGLSLLGIEENIAFLTGAFSGGRIACRVHFSYINMVFNSHFPCNSPCNVLS